LRGDPKGGGPKGRGTQREEDPKGGGLKGRGIQKEGDPKGSGTQKEGGPKRERDPKGEGPKGRGTVLNQGIRAISYKKKHAKPGTMLIETVLFGDPRISYCPFSCLIRINFTNERDL
jgi:hypothetical protein